MIGKTNGADTGSATPPAGISGEEVIMTLPIPTHVATFGDFMVLDFEGCSQRSYGRFEIRDGQSGRTIGAFQQKARAIRYARGNAVARLREAEGGSK